MTTRRSLRNLHAVAQTDTVTQSVPRTQQTLTNDINVMAEDDSHRDYDLNRERAMRKKAKACQAAYLVTSEIKGENQIFTFSAAMYELYRNSLCEHFQNLNDNNELNLKVRFKDISDKSGLTVESQLKVYQTSASGYDRLKYTISMYHTKSRIMVNGRQVMLFNDEHSKITESILTCEQVAVLDKELLSCIEDGLRTLSVEKAKPQASSKSNTQTLESKTSNNEAVPLKGNSSSVSNDPHKLKKDNASNLNVPEGISDQNFDIALCPICQALVEEGICCENCEHWYHFHCENINEVDQKIYENTDTNYVCLACGFNQQCEGLDDSLVIDDRHSGESDPVITVDENLTHITDTEETHRKEGFEPGPVSDPSNDSSKYHAQEEQKSQIRESKPSGERQIFKTVPYNCQVTRGKHPGPPEGMQAKTLQSTDDVMSIPNPPEVNHTPKAQSSQGQSTQDNDQIAKPNKQQKRIGKQKMKENEQDEQLKLAKSVINNLERKLIEVENSNRLMKQELNLVRGENNLNGNDPVTNQHNIGRPEVQQNARQEGVSNYDLNQIKDQVRNLELEAIKSRLYSLELSVLQQRPILPCQHYQYPSSALPGFAGFGAAQPYPVSQGHPFLMPHQHHLPQSGPILYAPNLGLMPSYHGHLPAMNAVYGGRPVYLPNGPQYGAFLNPNPQSAVQRPLQSMPVINGEMRRTGHPVISNWAQPGVDARRRVVNVAGAEMGPTNKNPEVGTEHPTALPAEVHNRKNPTMDYSEEKSQIPRHHIHPIEKTNTQASLEEQPRINHDTEEVTTEQLQTEVKSQSLPTKATQAGQRDGTEGHLAGSCELSLATARGAPPFELHKLQEDCEQIGQTLQSTGKDRQQSFLSPGRASEQICRKKSL